jgi:hypothetical protein
MRIQFRKSLFLALGAYCAPALLMAQSYLPLPETSAPVYRPVSANYYSEPSLVSRMATPPGEADEVPSPADGTAVEVPSDSYDAPVMEATKGGKGCGQKACGKGCASGSCGSDGGMLGMGYLSSTDGCLGEVFGGPCCWYGGVYAICWERDNERETQITVRSDNERDAILNNRSVAMEDTLGYQLTIGRYICCGTADGQTATVFDPAGAPSLQTSFDLSTLTYDNGAVVAVSSLVDGAAAHRVSRDYEFRNLELNLVHHTCCGTTGGGKCGGNKYEVSLLGGFRYLQFEDNFLFESDFNNTDFAGDVDEIRYSIDVENRLYGLQLGTRADYYATSCFGIHAVGKMGLYLNDVDHQSYIGGANGAAIVGSGPNAGRAYDINNGKTDIAFIGEIDLGVSYRWGHNWRARAGYRVIALSQVAQAMDQIPVYFQDIDGVTMTDSESSMYLHGGYAGIEFNF